MAQIAGITIDRAVSGKPIFAHIDLRKHAEFISILEEKGLEVEKPIKWTAKMKRSLAEAQRGEVYSRSLEELLNV